jgi:hypothetical protein
MPALRRPSSAGALGGNDAFAVLGLKAYTTRSYRSWAGGASTRAPGRPESWELLELYEQLGSLAVGGQFVGGQSAGGPARRREKTGRASPSAQTGSATGEEATSAAGRGRLVAVGQQPGRRAAAARKCPRCAVVVEAPAFRTPQCREALVVVASCAASGKRIPRRTQGAHTVQNGRGSRGIRGRGVSRGR